MKINLSPVRMDDRLVASVIGNVLTVNGTAYDFGPLAEGGTLPREAVGCPLLASDVTREGGHITLTLILPHGSDAPEAARFPQPITVTQSGPIPLPVAYAEEATK